MLCVRLSPKVSTVSLAPSTGNTGTCRRRRERRERGRRARGVDACVRSIAPISREGKPIDAAFGADTARRCASVSAPGCFRPTARQIASPVLTVRCVRVRPRRELWPLRFCSTPALVHCAGGTGHGGSVRTTTIRRVPLAYISLFDMFKIGIGPTSSHTVGQMMRGRFLMEIVQISRASRAEVELYGSFAHTGWPRARHGCGDPAGSRRRSAGPGGHAQREASCRLSSRGAKLNLLGRRKVAFDTGTPTDLQSRLLTHCRST